jgi:hypothetical protein
MKLKYLKESLGYGQSYCCNEYSCSSPSGINENEDMQVARFPVSKYNILFDFVEINKDFRNSGTKDFVEDAADSQDI